MTPEQLEYQAYQEQLDKANADKMLAEAAAFTARQQEEAQEQSDREAFESEQAAIKSGPHKYVDGIARPLTQNDLEIQATLSVSAVRDGVLSSIAMLESEITERRKREAMSDDAGGTAEGRAWMANINSQIAALREAL